MSPGALSAEHMFLGWYSGILFDCSIRKGEDFWVVAKSEPYLWEEEGTRGASLGGFDVVWLMGRTISAKKLPSTASSLLLTRESWEVFAADCNGSCSCSYSSWENGVKPTIHWMLRERHYYLRNPTRRVSASRCRYYPVRIPWQVTLPSQHAEIGGSDMIWRTRHLGQRRSLRSCHQRKVGLVDERETR